MMNNVITRRIELAVRSKIASSGRDAASVRANLDCGKHIGITNSFENASDRNNTFQEINANEANRENIPNQVGEFSVPKTLFNITVAHS